MAEYLTENYMTDEQRRVLYLIESYPFATIVPVQRGSDFAFVPMIRDEREPELVVLLGHVDNENPVLAQLDGQPVQALFHGPNAYISPLDYETSQLPTWNYSVATVGGSFTLIRDEAEKARLMLRTVETLEARNGSTYRLDDSELVRGLIERITFFRLRAESLHGVFKYSQDKDAPDRARARERLLEKLSAQQGRTIERLADDIPAANNGSRRRSPVREIHANVLGAIGNTPVVRLNKVGADAPVELFAKLELTNPGGSIKDRIGRWLLEDAERSGRLKPGDLVVEGTGGNTGVGLAMAAAVKGYRCIFTVPDKMSEGKIRLLRALGAKVVVTPTVPPPDPRNYCAVAREIAASEPHAIYIDQYNNLANRECHYRTTGPEILRQLPDIDVLVAGLGTGGTLCGTAMYLKEARPSVKVIGVDPVGSILYEKFKNGIDGEFRQFLIEGIGKDCVPANMDFDLIDDVVQVGDRESFLMTRDLLEREGIYAGGSSGAALVGALRWIREAGENLAGKRLLVILPDSGSRYLSKVYDDEWMRERGLLDEPAPEEEIGEVSHAVGR
jgi:cystathionine beta-synthase